MFLNEIATSDEVKIKRINKVLKETYGFTLASEIKTGKLNQLYTKIADDLYNLKLDLSTAQDPAYVQNILVLEGLKILITRNNNRLDEQAMLASRGGRKLELVVNKLGEYVRKACDIGDSYETALADAMRGYEVMPYRFSKELVEHELRKITVHDCTDALVYDPLAVESVVVEGEDCNTCDDCKCDPCECDKEEAVEEELDETEYIGPIKNPITDPFGPIDKGEEEVDEANIDRYAERDWVRGMQKDKAKAAGDEELELSLVGNDEEEADDFFSYQSKKTKRNEMKENAIKKLRRLIEAETDQAESLIAAKSFSQELQDMVEKLGRLVNEDLPAVADQMRDSHGADVATGFEDTVSTTLNGIMDSLRNSKQELDNSVSTIANGGMPELGTDMDGDFSDEELGGEFDDAELDVDADVELDLGGDEFGGEEIGDIEEPLGRAKKESIKILGKKIVEAQAKIARIKAKQ